MTYRLGDWSISKSKQSKKANQSSVIAGWIDRTQLITSCCGQKPEAAHKEVTGKAYGTESIPSQPEFRRFTNLHKSSRATSFQLRLWEEN